MKQKASVLALDRGKKYIGCAYALEDSSIVFPIGYLLNDMSFLANLSDTIVRYRVKQIVVGQPRDEWARKQIAYFIASLAKVTGELPIGLFDEDYTSVQAGEKINNFQKNVAEDTVAAMLILERWIERNEEKKRYEQLKNSS